MGKLINPMPGMSSFNMKASSAYQSSNEVQRAVDEYWKVKARVRSLELTLDAIDNIISQLQMYEVRAESGEFGVSSDGDVDPAKVERRENILDIGGETATKVVAGSEYGTPTLSNIPVDLADFLSRPLKVSDYAIAMDTEDSRKIQVWESYFNSPTVRAKLRNYSLIRATMNVRIKVSGMPFHAGRLQVAYIPFANLLAVPNYFATESTVAEFKYAYWSQTRGCKTIDVANNMPLDIVIPYVSPQPMIRLFNADEAILAGSSSFDDTVDMGTLYISTLNKILASSTAPTSVYVYVYIWLTDVLLGCPTGTQMEITAEAGDERVVGPVESIATRGAEIAESLEMVSSIGPYAKASSIVMRGLAHLSALFGWSYPNVIGQPMRMKNEPYQNGAQCVGSDTGKRITLDPKQELTVDPRVVGLDHDELAISSLCAIEGLIDRVTWNTNSASMTALQVYAVHPRIGKNYNDDTNAVIQPTPTSFAVAPFAFWRGKIKFRFEIVASKFHRGNIAVLYEPNVPQLPLTLGSLSLNKQYLTTVDIQETQSFEVCVDWAFPRAWARNINTNTIHRTIGATNISNIQEGDQLKWFNGALVLFPLTQLQNPMDIPVRINVYLSAEDMHVACPTVLFLPNKCAFEGEVEEEKKMELKAESYEEKCNANDVSCLDLNPTGASSKFISHIHFGEEVLSFRSLLKRFNTTDTDSQAAVVSAGSKFVTRTGYVYPPVYPSFEEGESDGANGARPPSILSYLRAAFLGMRGGMRKRTVTYGLGITSFTDDTRVSLSEPATELVPGMSVVTSYAPHSHIEGTVQYVQSTNGGIEFELPCYTNNLFLMATGDPAPAESVFDPFFFRGYEIQMATVGNLVGLEFTEQTATAEDFTLLRYVAAMPYTYEIP